MDEGAVRAQGENGGKGAFRQRFDTMKMRGLGQTRHDSPRARPADFGRGDIAGQEGERPLAGDVDSALQARMQAAQKPPQAVEAACLLLGQIAAATDLRPERRHRPGVGQDRAQMTGARQIGDGAGVAEIGLALAPGKTPARTVHGDARRMDEPEALHRQGRFKKVRERPRDVAPDHRLAAPFGRERAQIGNGEGDPLRRVLDHPVEAFSARLIRGADPVQNLGGIHADGNPHGASLPLPRTRMPRLAGVALQSHQGHRVISGRARAATRAAARAAARAAQPPKPSTAASMTTIPASPAPLQLLAAMGAVKRGKAT